MPQRHFRQWGTFHITTNAKERSSWCIESGVPQILIDNLIATKLLQSAKVYAFCILPDHMHMLVSPGEKGLSAFMHSFKRNSSKDIRYILKNRTDSRICATTQDGRSRGSVTPAIPRFAGWQSGFHDERIRSAKQRSAAFSYVQNNAFRHKIVSSPEKWPWTSLHFADIVDYTEPWFDSPYDFF